MIHSSVGRHDPYTRERAPISTGKEKDEAYQLYAREMREVLPVEEATITALWEKLPDRYRGFWREKVLRPELKFRESSWALPTDLMEDE